MDSRQMSMSDSIDWNDPAFSTSEFQDSMIAESPWGNTALHDFTNLADDIDSPAVLPGQNLRTPSKAGLVPGSSATVPHARTGVPPAQSTSTDYSSQDSASDSSSRRKRKTTSESPASDPITDVGMKTAQMKREELLSGVDGFQGLSGFGQTYNEAMPNLAVDSGISENNEGMFDLNSAASSPNLHREFDQQLSLDAKITMPASAATQYARQSPVQTINPGMFSLTDSRDQSPVTNSMMFNNPSPNPIFSTPQSDNNDAFSASHGWSVAQNPSWPADFANQMASPNALAFTPSPLANGATPAASSRQAIHRGRSNLHIAPISAKSRVETQINVVMTLETPPVGVEQLHLPLHTIAKSKLLSKEEYDKSTVLELHTMLVCSSAMHNASLKERALQRAATQSNDEVQSRAEAQRDTGDEEKNDMKNVDEADKPANGGEVRICNNCIQRERKRAGRKKLKREEEQAHWERYETERVVVFNSNEFLPFKPFDPSQEPQREGGMGTEEPYIPPEGALSVTAAMRIACYCRHQSEKEGFQVIFTLKDQRGNVVAQEMSDSILITDDHKTHPPSLTPMTSDMMFSPSVQFPSSGLPTSYSMMDLSAHTQPFTSSRSTGNLQALSYGTQPHFNPHSHVHQLPTNSGFPSQATSATMTPTNLSRPGSPTSAGQAGPNKKQKRKSSTFHKRVPSGLMMTPRVDSHPSASAALQTGMAMPSAFSPTGAGFGANDNSFMTIPNANGPAQFLGSGPPTPANEQQAIFGMPHQLDIARAQNGSAYFSHPSSAVPSRSNSPILQQNRPNLGTFPRNPVQTTTNQIGRVSQMYNSQAAPNSAGPENDQASAPSITKITPNEGPVAGGTEVSIFGYNFTHGTQVLFGDSVAPTTFYGSQSILAVSPPCRRGSVHVKLVNSPGSMHYSSPQTNNPIFTYTDTNPRMMEMALRFLSQQQTGDPSKWMQYTNEVANQFMQTSISPAGIQGTPYNYVAGNKMLYAESSEIEEMVLRILDVVDLCESPILPRLDLRMDDGATMLSLASALGMHRVAAALLARGANADVRDRGGYTPLMQSALHGHLKTFQLLLVRGADPTIRSLKGYAAIDLIARKDREAFLGVLRCTPRIETRRPSLQQHYSFNSHASKASWDISSASFYESENDASEMTASMPASRRPSANFVLPIVPEGTLMASPPPVAAMIAWRDALTAQILHFQQIVQCSMSSSLLDHHESGMVHRLSSLVPGRGAARQAAQENGGSMERLQILPGRFWEMFSCVPATTAVPPPAYSEIYPDGVDEAEAKTRSLKVALIDAIADTKCSLSSERASHVTEAFSHSVTVSPSDGIHRLMRLWLLMPLFVVMTSFLLHVFMPFSIELLTQRCDTSRAASSLAVH